MSKFAVVKSQVDHNILLRGLLSSDGLYPSHIYF